MSKKVHLIATGGAIMHQLAIALHIEGNTVTGSDDKIADPAKSNLESYGLLPVEGWYPERIHKGLDFVILGMHAKIDNPELLKAQELGLKVVSFPEYVADKCKDKIRVVIGGSHGKTSTTAMVMHVLNQVGLEFDYLVGSKLDDFDRMVSFSDAGIAIIEGDEYLTSCLDRRPKFHWYNPQIAVLTGVSLDHVNVFPTEEIYEEQFEIFVNQLEESAELFYYANDPCLQRLAEGANCHVGAYDGLRHKVENGITYILKSDGTEVPLKVFGDHMLQNLNAAYLMCRSLDLDEDTIYDAFSSFGGTARRMEIVRSSDSSLVMRDFAHSPSKLQATIDAVKKQFVDRPLIGFFELHTFSSVQKDFLPRYKGTMDAAEKAYVYMDKSVFERKGQSVPSREEVAAAFGEVEVIINKQELDVVMDSLDYEDKTVLFMSSGTFSGTNFN